MQVSPLSRELHGSLCKLSPGANFTYRQPQPARPHTLLLHCTQTYFHYSLFLFTDRYTLRQTDAWWYHGFQSAFSATKRNKGRGRRRESIQFFDCFKLRSHSADLYSKLLLSFIYANILLLSNINAQKR